MASSVRWLALSLAAASAALSCGSEQRVASRALLSDAPAQSPPAASAPAPSVMASASAPASPPPTGPIEKLALAAIACEVEPDSVSLRGDPNVKLCDANGKRCFLEATRNPFSAQDLTARTAQGTHPAVLLQLSYVGMTLRGFTQAPPRQFSARPIAFRGYYIPDELELKEGRDKKLLVSAPIEEWVKPIEVLEQELGCADVAWQPQLASRDEAVARLMKIRGEGDPIELRKGETKLYSSKGVALATLAPQKLESVMAYQVAGKRRLIVIEVANGTVFGWVDLSSLTSDLHGGNGFGTGSGHLNARGVKQPSSGLRCAHAVPLLALVEGSRLEVGQLEQDNWFTLGGDLDAVHREVVLRHPKYLANNVEQTNVLLRVVEGAKLAVLKEAIADCEQR